MDDRDAEGSGDGDVPHQMLVGKDLGPELIDLRLGEGANFIGEWLFLVVGELGDLGIGILEQVGIWSVLSQQKFGCLA